jgi:hypothetical protein
MDEDLLMASRRGWLLLRSETPEGVRLDPPFLRYDPGLPRDERAALVIKLLDGGAAPPTRPS